MAQIIGSQNSSESGRYSDADNTSLSSTLDPHVQATSRQSHHTSSIRFDLDKNSRFFSSVILFRFGFKRKAIGFDHMVDIVFESLTPSLSCPFCHPRNVPNTFLSTHHPALVQTKQTPRMTNPSNSTSHPLAVTTSDNGTQPTTQ
jgi:hypothetical protein